MRERENTLKSMCPVMFVCTREDRSPERWTVRETDVIKRRSRNESTEESRKEGRSLVYNEGVSSEGTGVRDLTGGRERYIEKK